jgi:ABC-type uncharacterized transport system fused permease/ATPase subunit
MLCRILIQRPKIVILDQVFDDLDSKSAFDLFKDVVMKLITLLKEN